MRIFTALALSPEGQNLVYRQTAALREAFPRLKWVKTEALHITLSFFGEVPDGNVPAVEGALESAEIVTAPFTITVQGRETFPLRGPARVVYARIREGQQECIQVYREVSEIFKNILPVQKGDYTPHITLARVRRGSRWPASGENRNVPSGEVYLDRVVLYQSLLEPSGARYIKLAEKKLKTS